MTADEQLEKLGYSKIRHDDGSITYFKDNNDQMRFYIENNIPVCEWGYKAKVERAMSSKFQEVLKVINKEKERRFNSALQEALRQINDDFEEKFKSESESDYIKSLFKYRIGTGEKCAEDFDKTVTEIKELFYKKMNPKKGVKK